MLLSGSHMSKQGYLTQCSQCFVCSQNYQVCSTRRYCKESCDHNGQNPNIQIQDLHSHQVSNFTFSVASSRTPPAPQAIRKARCSATMRYQRGKCFFLSFVETQVTYTAVQNTDLFCWDYGVESVLSYLPLSHVAGQMMDVFLIMSKVVKRATIWNNAST